MGISVIERLINCLLHTGHLGVAVPEKFRQIALGFEAIEFGIVGHVDPIDGADILAPSQNLPYKALNLGQVDTAVGLLKTR